MASVGRFDGLVSQPHRPRCMQLLYRRTPLQHLTSSSLHKAHPENRFDNELSESNCDSGASWPKAQTQAGAASLHSFPFEHSKWRVIASTSDQSPMNYEVPITIAPDNWVAVGLLSLLAAWSVLWFLVVGGVSLAYLCLWAMTLVAHLGVMDPGSTLAASGSSVDVTELAMRIVHSITNGYLNCWTAFPGVMAGPLLAALLIVLHTVLHMCSMAVQWIHQGSGHVLMQFNQTSLLAVWAIFAAAMLPIWAMAMSLVPRLPRPSAGTSHLTQLAGALSVVAILTSIQEATTTAPYLASSVGSNGAAAAIATAAFAVGSVVSNLVLPVLCATACGFYLWGALFPATGVTSSSKSTDRSRSTNADSHASNSGSGVISQTSNSSRTNVGVIAAQHGLTNSGTNSANGMAGSAISTSGTDEQAQGGRIYQAIMADTDGRAALHSVRTTGALVQLRLRVRQLLWLRACVDIVFLTLIQSGSLQGNVPGIRLLGLLWTLQLAWKHCSPPAN